MERTLHPVILKDVDWSLHLLGLFLVILLANNLQMLYFVATDYPHTTIPTQTA